MSSSIACAAWCVDCGVFAQVQPVFCGVRCCGRGGFQTRPYGMGNGRSETRPYGMGSVRLTHGHAIALADKESCSRIWTQFAKGTSCAWNRFTWLPMLSPSPAPRGVWIVAFSHRCNRSSAVRGVVVGAGFKPAPTPWAMAGLKPASTGWVRSVSPKDTPLRFGQVTLAGYGRSLPKSTSCAWSRFTWLPMLSPSPAPRGVRIVAYLRTGATGLLRCAVLW